MKILYIAIGRDAAQVAAGSLRDIAQNVSLTWTETLPSALGWLQENRDVAAIVVEVEAQIHGCASFVGSLRDAGLSAPVVIVAPEPLRSTLAALKADAVYTVNSQSVQADLAHIVRSALLERRVAELDTQLAGARAEHQTSLRRTGSVCTALQERLLKLETAARNADERRASLEQTLATVEAARQHEEARHMTELASVTARLADLQAQHDALLTGTAAARAAFEQQVTDAAAALEGARQDRVSEAAAAAEHLAQRHAEFTAGLTQAARSRDALAQQVSVAMAALDDARQARAAEAAAAAEHLASREKELGAALAEASAARTALERTLAEADALHQQAQRRAAADLARAAERQAELESRLNQEAGTRAALERDLAETRTESTHARRRLIEVAAAVRRRTREHKARLEAQLNRERADFERALRARAEEMQQIQLEREALQQLLGTTRARVQHLQDTLADERQTYEHARSANESELGRLSAERDHTRQSMDQLRAAFDALEGVSSEHAIERARLESVLADRDAQLSAQAARHLVAEQATTDALAQIQERLRLALDAGSRDVTRLQRELDATRQELNAARTHAASLRDEAERVPVLRRQLDESQKETRRQFESAPYGLCRCTPDGTLTLGNRSLVRLLGYRTADDLRKVDFGTKVFESAGDLRWLIERSVSTATTEPVETTWRTKDRSRLLVRLQALATASDSIEIIVEDITSLRTVEERLRQATRMEAVGRLASEVAVTCDSMLRDVSQGGQLWLAAIDSDTPLRHQGEHLLGEVTRAASLLRKFAVYGNQQISAAKPVSVHRVLHDLEPVLKRVVGDDIELVLPRTSGRVDVDVEAERVERVLVNVASYARDRMLHGGRMKIDLATTVVDRGFIARYPHVRPGAHVLITVTEVPGAVRPASPIELRAEPAAADAGRSADKPGVDLGVLMRLIGECGGHLWMAAEPRGNMTLKIHLPKRLDDVVDPGAARARPDRGRQLARLFGH